MNRGQVRVMRRTRISVEDRRRVLAEQRAGGLSVAAFCRERQVPQASFYFWRRKLRNDAAPSPGLGSGRRGVPPCRGRPGPAGSKTAGFVEVQLPVEALAEARAIELRLPGDRSLVIRPGFDRSTLVALLATLASYDADPRNARSAALDGGRRWPRGESRR